MKVSKKIKITTHEEAALEDQEYFLKLTPLERLKEVQRMRELNFGEAAKTPMKRILKVIK